MPLIAQTLDALLEQVSGFQKLRWFHAQADPRWGACDDQCARLQSHELAQIADQVSGRENHVTGVALLTCLAIYFQGQLDIAHIGNFIDGRDPWAHRGKSVKALTLAPLPTTIHLP